MMKDAAVEIQLLIASHAHTPFDLARLGSTSRSWRIACNDDRSWRRFALEFSIPGSVSGFGEGASERGSGADGSEKTTCWTTFAAHARRHPGRLLLAHAFVAPRVARLALRLGLDIDIKNAHSEAPIRLFLTREEEEAGTVELVNLSEDESDRITPSPTWRPSLRDCTQAETRLALLFHILTRTSSREMQPHCIGLFGANRCYDDIYAMHLLPFPSVKHLRLPNTSPMDPICSLVRFAWCQMGEGLGLVTAGTLQGHVVRFARSCTDLDRMGPIPARSLPYMDLGAFEAWFDTFVGSIEEGCGRRVETAVGARGRRMQLPSIFLGDGPGTGMSITQGIKIEVSSFFIMSMARVCYRIRMEYLEEQCPHASVQLQTRHWRFRYLNGRMSAVDGDGVIGFYPTLSATNTSFTYCSYSDGGRVRRPPSEWIDDDEDEDEGGIGHLNNPVTSLEGSFTFRVGSLQASVGPPIEVEIPFVEFVRPKTVPV